MMKSLAKRVAGSMGGVIVGILISLGVVHAKFAYGVPIPFLLTLTPVIIVCMAIFGLVKSDWLSSFFIVFVLSFLAMGGNRSNARKTKSDWLGSLATLGLLIGALILIVGVIFSVKTFFLVGLVLILGISLPRSFREADSRLVIVSGAG